MPVGAVSGPVAVHNAGGTGTSTAAFSVPGRVTPALTLPPRRRRCAAAPWSGSAAPSRPAVSAGDASPSPCSAAPARPGPRRAPVRHAAADGASRWAGGRPSKGSTECAPRSGRRRSTRRHVRVGHVPREVAQGPAAGAGRPAAGRVALVFPYFRTDGPPSCCSRRSASPPWRRSCAASAPDARLRLHVPHLEQLRDELVAYAPAVVGISAMVSLTGVALRVGGARATEALPDALLVAGGPLPTVFPARFTGHVARGVPRGGRPQLSRVLPRLRGARLTRDARCRDSTSPTTTACSCAPAASPSTCPPCTTRRTSSGPSPSPTAASSTTPRTRPRGRQDGQQAHLARRHARLPLRLRLLLQAGVRQRGAAAATSTR